MALHRSRTAQLARSSKRSTVIGCRLTVASEDKLGARGTATLAEPGAVLRHAAALGLGRAALAGRGLIAPLGRAPPELGAVVDVVGHLERAGAVDHVLQGQCPFGIVAAQI